MILQDVDPAAEIVQLKSIEELSGQNDGPINADLVVLDTSPQFGREMGVITRLQDIEGIGSVIVVHEQNHSEIVRRYLDMGVAGVVPKVTEPPVLISAVRLVLSGGRYVPDVVLSKSEESGFAETTPVIDAPWLDQLTRRQMDVLKELGRGASNQEIGTRLGIALATVKLHVNAILNTLGVRNRTEAAIIAYRAGLTEFGQSA